MDHSHLFPMCGATLRCYTARCRLETAAETEAVRRACLTNINHPRRTPTGRQRANEPTICRRALLDGTKAGKPSQKIHAPERSMHQAHPQPHQPHPHHTGHPQGTTTIPR